MSGVGYRILKHCQARGRRLRVKGFTYDQIADVLALDHEVSPLRLYRYAHGRTAAAVVDDFNTRDPAGTASLREARLYDFEAWPETGRRPPAWVLVTLAAIYQTRARNLVADGVYATYRPEDQDRIDRTDHRDADPNRPPKPPRTRASMERTVTPTGPTVPALTQRECEDVFHAVGALETDVKRRNMLLQLALALGGAPSLALLRHLTPEESENLAYALHTPGGMDAASVTTIEKLTAQCRRLDDTIGPRAVLPIVDAKREVVARILARESLPTGIRDRLVTAYAQLSQLAGYLHYDLTDYDAATDRFEAALRAALDVGDATLIAYVHSWLSDMASFRNQPAAALDHAFAAQGWALRSPSHLLRARTAFTQAWALALENRTGTPSDKRASTSLRLLQAARTEATRQSASDPVYLYWIAESDDRIVGNCLNVLGRWDETISAVDKQLENCKSGHNRSQSLGLLQQAKALAHKHEIQAATKKITQAVDLASGHSSARVTVWLHDARASLDPWATTSYVRNVDELLHRSSPPEAGPAD